MFDIKRSYRAWIFGKIVGNIVFLIFSWMLTGVFGFTFIVCIVDSSYRKSYMSVIIILLIIVLAFLYLTLNARKYRRINKVYSHYLELFQTNPCITVNEIAKITRKNKIIVTFNILLMIKKKYLIEAAYDSSTETVIFSYLDYVVENEDEEEYEDGETQKLEEIVVKCNGCGASTKVTKGKAVACMYCGSQVGGLNE